ncbi:hypothetical protein RRG08_027194 [Elysia crispata]|uniref:Uncharacterized protein n=1 Tax=Elysia crispata TaxID=231223 RepID=A0AAE1A6N7_9GAST|nr:hypothetical protein RRG08_027194 [Elysia crispata]
MTQSSSNICPQYPSSTTSGDIRANLQTRHSLDLATDANGPRNFTMSDLSLLVISRFNVIVDNITGFIYTLPSRSLQRSATHLKTEYSKTYMNRLTSCGLVQDEDSALCSTLSNSSLPPPYVFTLSGLSQ